MSMCAWRCMKMPSQSIKNRHAYIFESQRRWVKRRYFLNFPCHMSLMPLCKSSLILKQEVDVSPLLSSVSYDHWERERRRERQRQREGGREGGHCILTFNTCSVWMCAKDSTWRGRQLCSLLLQILLFFRLMNRVMFIGFHFFFNSAFTLFQPLGWKLYLKEMVFASDSKLKKKT